MPFGGYQSRLTYALFSVHSGRAGRTVVSWLAHQTLDPRLAGLLSYRVYFGPHWLSRSLARCLNGYRIHYWYNFKTLIANCRGAFVQFDIPQNLNQLFVLAFLFSFDFFPEKLFNSLSQVSNIFLVSWPSTVTFCLVPGDICVNWRERKSVPQSM